MTCEHARTTKGTHYEYCEDCGAVRRVPLPGDPLTDPWHSCDLCRLR